MQAEPLGVHLNLKVLVLVSQMSSVELHEDGRKDFRLANLKKKKFYLVNYVGVYPNFNSKPNKIYLNQGKEKHVN